MKTTLGFLAGVLFIIGFFPYINAIIRGKTKPAKVSWLIWLSTDLITFSAMVVSGTLNGQMVGVIIGAVIVTVLALIKGEKGWSKIDQFCLAGAIVGITLWIISGDPDVAIVLISAVGFLGSIPTFLSAWKNPASENRLAWTIFWLSCVCAVLAIPKLTIADAVQPLVFFVIETIMMYLLYIRKRN